MSTSINSSKLNDFPLYLFYQGKNYQAYQFFGVHPVKGSRNKSYIFRVWAPKAKSVSVVGDFNNWDRNVNKMELIADGVWEVTIPKLKQFDIYKFSIEAMDGRILLKSDPYGHHFETRPSTASKIFESSFKWTDKEWIKNKKKKNIYKSPINIYEVHLNSWKINDDGNYYDYVSFANNIIPYLKKMSYTHIEFMPLTEYPFEGSWGYQVTGYYAPTSRFGTPDDFRKMINLFHENNISVILDWVPAHFPKDGSGLYEFDGTCCYEYTDECKKEHKAWGTRVFDYGKGEVCSFLISSACYWLNEFHIDGLRVDAVASMLYLDYDRRDGEWCANIYGGNENLEAVAFLKRLNEAVFSIQPDVLMIAEESTAWPMVTKPTDIGGLGFNFKWNMGWMNDILRYMAMDPYFRGSNHDMLTFSMMYAYSENYILPLSHDEVVHGKKSLLDKMYGDYEQKFKSLKLLYSFMYAHPGKKLLFMGGEIGQFTEWRFEGELDWNLLDFDSHKGIKNFVKDLNMYYKNNRSMHENDQDWQGFSWINESDRERSVVSFQRCNKSKRDKTIVVANFAAQGYEDYEIGVPSRGEYEVVLCTEGKEYGGKMDKMPKVTAQKAKNGEFPYSIKLSIPELCAMYIKKVKTQKS